MLLRSSERVLRQLTFCVNMIEIGSPIAKEVGYGTNKWAVIRWIKEQVR